MFSVLGAAPSDEVEVGVVLSRGVSGGGGDRVGFSAGGVPGDASVMSGCSSFLSS